MQLSVMRRLGATSGFARVHSRLAGLDARLYKATGGRLATANLGSGLQQLLLTTTGRRSGQPRTVTLAWFDGRSPDEYVVIGSNYGQPAPPAWALNLLADPDAVIEVRGRQLPVRARVAEGDERRDIWSRVVDRWPAYSAYDERSGDRRIHVFVLEPRG